MKPITLFLAILALLALATCSKKVIPVDISPPEITLLGKDSIYILLGEPLADPGALAIDDFDGELNTKIISNWDSIMKLGGFGKKLITYRVKDKAGHLSIITRIVYIDFTGSMPLGEFSASIDYYFSGGCVSSGGYKTSGTATITATPFKDHFTLTVRADKYSHAFKEYTTYTLIPKTNNLAKIDVTSLTYNYSNIGNSDGSATFDHVSSLFYVNYYFSTFGSGRYCNWNTKMQLQHIN